MELKISLLHGLGSTNPLPTLFSTFRIPLYSELSVSSFDCGEILS